jgi:alkylated DNA nucleotide flippase Atl1
MCATVGIRHLTSSPDVKWNRVVRKNSQLQYTDTSGSWFSHRKPLSEMHENPVNTAYKK